MCEDDSATQLICLSFDWNFRSCRRRVDLLKVDVERAELNVLKGILPEDWPRIRQVSMHACDGTSCGMHSTANCANDGNFDMASGDI